MRLARTIDPVAFDTAAKVLRMSVPLYIFSDMIIDCDSCVVRDIKCDDCVVSVLIGNPRSMGSEESRVIDLLASRGLVPPLRFELQEDTQAGESLSG